MLIGIVGTTIAPWMQFYQQSAVVEKNIKVEHDWASGFDVISGFLMAVAVVFFIIVALRGNPFCQRNKDKRCPRGGHRARPPPCRPARFDLICHWPWANASLFSASILPLATAYYGCEGMGWESGMDF